MNENFVSLNLGWSRAIEDLAFGRAHRLRRTRAVEVQHLVIADTVKDRLLNAQKHEVWFSMPSDRSSSGFSDPLLVEAWERVPARRLAVTGGGAN